MLRGVGVNKNARGVGPGRCVLTVVFVRDYFMGYSFLCGCGWLQLSVIEERKVWGGGEPELSISVRLYGGEVEHYV
jgi:hypothetical protein